MARHIRIPFNQFIKPIFAGRPTHYLEIGVADGDTAAWMFGNVLTHPRSTATLVDPWEPYHSKRYGQIDTQSQYERVIRRMEPWSDRCEIHRMRSDDYFGQLDPISSFDLIFLDGDHSLQAVTMDAWHAIRRVHPGVIVFDDTYLRHVQAAVREFHRKNRKTYLLRELYRTTKQQAFAVGWDPQTQDYPNGMIHERTVQ